MSRGGLTTKLHARVDALGYPVELMLTEGQVQEITVAPALVRGVANAYVVADKGYDQDPLRDQLLAQHCVPVIPARKSRTPEKLRAYDRHLYKDRFLIECFFQRIKRHRRVATRYEKLARNYLAMVTLAAVLVWLL